MRKPLLLGRLDIYITNPYFSDMGTWTGSDFDGMIIIANTSRENRFDSETRVCTRELFLSDCVHGQSL